MLTGFFFHQLVAKNCEKSKNMDWSFLIQKDTSNNLIKRTSATVAKILNS